MGVGSGRVVWAPGRRGSPSVILTRCTLRSLAPASAAASPEGCMSPGGPPGGPPLVGSGGGMGGGTAMGGGGGPGGGGGAGGPAMGGRTGAGGGATDSMDDG